MSKLILCICTLFLLANTQKNEDYFRRHVDEAVSLVQTSCHEYLSSLVENGENHTNAVCDAAAKISAEDINIKSQQALIGALEKFLKAMPNGEIYSEAEKKHYTSYQKNMTTKSSDLEKKVIGCLAKKDGVLQSNIECRVAAEIMLEKLKAEQRGNLSGMDSRAKYIADFIKYPEKLATALTGKCKATLQNSWNSSIPSLDDVECEAALEAKEKLEAVVPEKPKKTIATEGTAMQEQYKIFKDREYFANNIEEAKKTSSACKAGFVADISECEVSIEALSEKIIEEQKLFKYQEYYNTHPLAAKFQIKFCNSSMLDFDTKCQGARNAMQLNEGKNPKLYNEELLIKNIKQLNGNLKKAKEILNGECKKLMADPWYYIDESLRNEECDAAAEVARETIEKKR